MVERFAQQPQGRIVHTLGFDAPRAWILACGHTPVRMVAPRLDATPRADAILGATALGPRGLALLESLLAGGGDDTPILITCADSAQPQIFAALRELARQGEVVPPNIHLLDLLHMDRPQSRAYNARRLDAMVQWLGGCTPQELAAAQALIARQTALLDQLAPLRAARRVSGTDALAAIAGAATMHPADHIATMEGWLADLADAPALPGTPTYVTGTAHEGDELYRTIEAEGRIIVGEDHAWGQRFPHAPAPGHVDTGIAARLPHALADSGARDVLHLAIGGDEAAPWDEAAIRAALPDDVTFTAIRCGAVPDARFLGALDACGGMGRGEAPPPPAKRPHAPKAPPSRSRKVLTSVADFNTYQREWFASVREQVAAGSRFAMVNANAPQEILRAMDVPFVVNQWWASIVAAKQQSRRYQALLRDHHYPSDVEAYSAQGLAASFDDDADNAPWGGLPRPDFVHAVASSDPTARIFAAWARESGAAPYVYEKTCDPRADLFCDWWVKLTDEWDSALEPERIDLMTAELRDVIAQLETATGKPFDLDRFTAIMDLVNEQERYYRATRDMIASAIPAPIGVVDSMPATMVPQWHRGTVWARDAARAFHDEVKGRIEAGLGVCQHERIRLMWVGRGMWSDMGFYQQWEESHGAVFVWSMYLALAADGYIRDLSGGRDPLRALASRCITMGDELRMPTWAGPWHVHEADSHAIDGVVALADADPFVVRALRDAGYPVLHLATDNFNREGEDAAATHAAITGFIEGECAARAARRTSI